MRARLDRRASAEVDAARRFPYQVVYVVHADGVVVLAVAHDRRAPSYWAARIESDEAV